MRPSVHVCVHVRDAILSQWNYIDNLSENELEPKQRAVEVKKTKLLIRIHG